MDGRHGSTARRGTSAEEILLGRVEKILRAAGGLHAAAPALLECLRRVLEEPSFSPEEESAASLDDFIAARVERALAATLEYGSRSAGFPVSLLPPRVTVVRTRPTATTPASEVRGPLPTLGTRRIHDLGQAGRGVLVLADAPAVDGYLDRHGNFKLGERGLGLHFAAGEEDLMVTVGDAGLEAVHVLDFTDAFPRLELTLELATGARAPSVVSAPVPAPSIPPAVSAAHEIRPGAHVPGDSFDRLVGSVFDGKYLLTRRIGKGGFGVVYEARDLRLDHKIAIKLMRPDATRSAADLEAFKSEARRATRLSHPNIVDWKTFEKSQDGTWYFVMELLEGEELDTLLKREGVLDAKRAGAILLQVLDALRAAHDLGDGQSVLHLDLKPKNIFVLRGKPGEPERVKVIDFGIGQFAGNETPASPRAERPARVSQAEDEVPDQTLFSVHRFEDAFESDTAKAALASDSVQRSNACTPEYAAPEQCAHLLPELEPLPLDGRADLYALGVVAFQMLTGRLPFEKPKRRKDLLHIKQSVEPAKAGESDVPVPKRLAAFVDRCLQRNRDARFHDSEEAYRALEKIVDPPVPKVLIAAVALLAVAAVAAAWTIGKSVARPSLDVFARQDGVETSLGRSKLFLGPARDHSIVRVSGLAASSSIESVRVVGSRETGARAVEGLHAERRGEREVLLTADPAPGRVQRPVYLEVKPAGRDAQWSLPFDVVWLGNFSWDVEEAFVPGLGSRALDPDGLDLSVRIRGASSDLAGVRVEASGKTLAAAVDPSRSRDGECVFTAPLSGLCLAAGPAKIVVAATDLAGRRRDASLDLVAVDAKLALTDASLDATAVGKRYSISPRSDPNLRFASSRKADVAWTVRDEGGNVLSKGGAQGVDGGTYPLAGFSKLRGGSSFSGTIEVVADESAYALHADPEHKGVDRKRLEFLFAAIAPDVSVRLATADGKLGKPFDPDHPTFTSRKDLVIRVGRESALPVRVQVLAAPVDRPGDVRALEPKTLVDREAIAADFPILLPADGAYAFTVRSWRYDAPGDEARDPDATLRATVVVDGTKPKLRLRAPNGDLVLRSRQDGAPKLELEVADDVDAKGLLRTPVDHLHWDLVRVDRPGEALASGVLETVIPGGTPVAIEIPKPWEVGPKELPTRDGTYRVVVEGTDAAGNEAVPAQIAIEAAVDGPELELTRPASRVTWTRGDSGGFEIQVVARDPNGVSDVRGVVRREGASDVPFHLRATGDPRRDEVSVWTGGVSFDEAWANAVVEVRLAAEDGAGTLAETTEAREIGSVDRVFPLRIGVEFDGAPVESLRLVEGNSTMPYLFGGRVDAEEERVYATAGLPPYNTLSTARSWRIPYEAHEIKSFYLDEREVSVAQYLAFVRTPGGYATGANWPTNSPPDERRRKLLEHVLSSMSQDLPVVDVTWEEASAYAHWTGKRLPSLVEWEYAVRGGTKYRPFASAGDPPRAPRRGDVNFDPEGAGDGAPWPCSQGGDVTETGVRDLSGNVAEWTATPASYLVGSAAAVSYPAHALEHREAFLDPRKDAMSESMERFWVAGGSFRSARADFMTVDRRARTWHGDSVGFRCAADVEIATVAAESAEKGRPSFRGIFE